jgi:hypothetical protein
MAETPGILCQGRKPVNTKDGTMCAAQSPMPGITGDRSWLDPALGDLSWATSELSSATQWVGHELWAGTMWAGSQIWSGAEWARVEIKAGVKWSWGEIHDGAVWLGDKAYDACKYLETLFHKILHAPTWDILKAIAEPILGPFFQQAGILWGVIESLGKDVMSLLELGKMLVLAGCYELMIHPDVATALALNPTTMPMVLTALALKAVAHEIPDLARQMKKADDQLKKMITDLWHMVSNWDEFLGFVKAMGQHIKQEAVNDFNKLKSCAEHRSLANDFEAGRILGRALYQVVMLILIVVSGVAAVRSALRFLARVPALLRAAKILRYGGEVEELIETEKVIQGTKQAEEIAEAKGTPKKAIAEQPKPLQAGSRIPQNPYNISTTGMTAAERDATVEYARRSNTWLEQNGPIKVQSTKGLLRSQASAAARSERLRAARAGQPYLGQAGHVPDTALTGLPDPPAGWLDMPGTSNNVAGGGLSSRVGQSVDAITVDGKLP